MIPRMTVAKIAPLVLVALLAGCGGGKPEVAAPVQDAPAASGPTSPAPAQPSTAALKKAAQGYIDAFLSGNAGKLSTYVHPDCEDPDLTSADLAAVKQIADGHRVIVDTVVIGTDGTGGTDKYHLDKGSPEELRRAMAQAEGSKKRGDGYQHSFRPKDGEWYWMPDPCMKSSSSPSP